MITDDSKKAIKQEIARLEDKVNQLKRRKKPVKDQLDFFNDRIASVQTRIDELKKDI